MTSSPVSDSRRRDLALLRRVRDRMDREYAQPLDVEALARGVHMSAGHLSREFKAAYGESPYSYLMTRRIERAMALLRRGDLSVTEVCFAVGCQSLGTFSTRFTELVGMPPSEYRRQAAGRHGRACRRARPRRSPDRSGIEKHRPPAARSVERHGHHHSHHASSRTTTRTPRWRSTATSSASRSATTSATRAMRWLTVGPAGPARPSTSCWTRRPPTPASPTRSAGRSPR